MSALPQASPAPSAAAERLAAWLAPYRRVFVLTGAGVSTGSGIPDYRDDRGEWKRAPPVTYQAFVGDPRVRARYWARSFVGWPRIAEAAPNAAHRALARWEAHGRLSLLLTQNVDGLHQRAGSRTVLDLHGRLDEVVCLGCGERLPRPLLQDWFAEANPDWAGLHAAAAPDGDADLDGRDFAAFRVPDCLRCGGLLKPDVVFFGENVPRPRVERAYAALRASAALLVAGSSLMVYSGYRFARLAAEAGLPIAILNRGRTRADELAALKLEADAGDTLDAALA
ncbi:NAD-dependent protein deacetylase [Vulcaniibacterium tengchongense]|uniref:NAD-dependent protein deacetylase n=1 Tax=Vulcaniibacterium tengchongense TaxID=1273429 RepID=A0A3N4VFS2_9GAMM|nr:NAD-dependent protein deacetylase [Vulcaniibacterium tengchongense]RPE81872.1 NAD-dependent SIR2 family protein deacetylase [Vulcaniibacterium tengchongense]